LLPSSVKSITRQPYKSHKDFIILQSSLALSLSSSLRPGCINFEWEQTTAKHRFSGSSPLKIDFLNCQKKIIQNYIPFFTHLVFNLNSNLQRKIPANSFFLSFFFLAFNVISTNSNSSHLGWWWGGHIMTHNFESGSTKDCFSFWKEDFNVIYFLIKCLNSINWLIFFYLFIIII
jgi:hypothetical protein